MTPSPQRPTLQLPKLGERTTAAPGTPATESPLDSESLLQGRKTIEIAHNGSTYRLQATRQGKLILTK